MVLWGGGSKEDADDGCVVLVLWLVHVDGRRPRVGVSGMAHSDEFSIPALKLEGVMHKVEKSLLGTLWWCWQTNGCAVWKERRKVCLKKNKKAVQKNLQC